LQSENRKNFWLKMIVSMTEDSFGGRTGCRMTTEVPRESFRNRIRFCWLFLLLSGLMASFHAERAVTLAAAVIPPLSSGSPVEPTQVPPEVNVTESADSNLPIGAALGAASATAFLFAVWVATLRHRVRAQTRIVQGRLDEASVLKERYQDLFENASDMVYTHDLAGNITSVNRAGERSLGYTQAELLHLNLFQILTPESCQRLRQMIQNSLTFGERLSYELEFIAKEGSRVCMEVSARTLEQDRQISGIHGLARDITERKRTEKALRESEERFSKAFQATPVPICISDLGQSRIVDVNDGFLRLFGYAREELIGRTALEIGLWVNPKDRDQIIQRLQNQESVRDFECRLRTKSGEIRDAFLAVEIVELGQEPCALFITHDLTDRLCLENQLRHALKMEAVGQLAAGIAHDFNNIMTIIQGHTSLLLSSGECSGKMAESLNRVLVASERAGKLTRQMMAFSRKQPVEPRLLDLNGVVGADVKMLQRLLGENISLEFQPAQPLPVIHADPALVEQMIINLAVNARDAMPNGGRLVISTSHQDIEAASAQRSPEARPGRFVCLSVMDTGCGMNAATLGRIFEPFFTTKATGQGTGLGLAMVYGTMKQHQGWIEVASRVGQGTTFTLFFPGRSGRPEVPTPAVAEMSLPNGTETVLVVEDEEVLRHLVCSVLSQQGYRVWQAVSGEEALRRWRRQVGQIDLLLTDVRMPGGVSGLELAEEFLSENPGLKIVFTSGYVVEKSASRFVLREGVNFLPKPYHPTRLAQIVRENLDQGARNQNAETKLAKHSNPE
jgi:two-component system cell cycle sensor histidine kinase/response regulator CckA